MSTIRESRNRPYFQDALHALLELSKGKASSIHVPQVYRYIQKNGEINPPGRNAKSNNKRAIEKLTSRGLIVACGKQKVKLSDKGRKLFQASRSTVGVETHATPSVEQYVRIAKLMDESSKPASPKRSPGMNKTQLEAEYRKLLKKVKDRELAFERMRLESEEREAQMRLENEALKHTIRALGDLTHDRPLSPLSDLDDEETHLVDDTEITLGPQDSSMDVESDSDDDEQVHNHLIAPWTPPPIHAPLPMRGPPGFLLTRSGSLHNVQMGRVTPARTVGPSSPPASRVYDVGESSQMTIVDDGMVVDKSIQPLAGTSSGHLLTPDNTPERPVRSSSYSSLLPIGGNDKTIQDLERKLADSQRELVATREELETTRVELLTLKASHGNLEGRLERSETDRESLESRLAAESKELVAANTQISNLTDLLAARDKEVTALAANASMLQVQFTSLGASYEALRGEKAAVDSELSRISTQLMETTRVKDILEAQAFGQQVEFENKTFEAGREAVLVDILEREKTNLQSHLEELREELREANKEIKHLDGELDKIKKKRAHAKQLALRMIEEDLESNSESEETENQLPRKRKRHSC